MRTRSFVLATLAATLCASPAFAQKKGDAAQPSAGKADAKSLLASGLKLFQAKDYLGALAVFEDAYERFPSTKILLNIATTMKQLGRNADAANTYQRYLDAEDSDPAKKNDVTKVLAELDAKVGIIEISVTPEDAEIQLAGDERWRPASDTPVLRVAPGAFMLRARRDGYEPAELSGGVAAGKRTTMKLTLAPVPVAPPVETTGGVAAVGGVAAGDRTVDEGARDGRARTRFGAYALAHVDIANAGGAARIGLTFELIPRLQAEAGALIGPASGGYVGARYGILPGRFRPLLAVGMPVFIEDGARFAIRGAAGLEVVLSPRISLVAEAGVERVLNPGMNYVETVFIPAIGAAGRL